jgi:transcriptional regulator with XRE-family HTH domain
MVHLTSIKLRRLDLGLTRAELAARAAIAPARLSAIEEDRVRITDDELRALARALCVGDVVKLATHNALVVSVRPPRLKDHASAVGHRDERSEDDLRRPSR